MGNIDQELSARRGGIINDMSPEEFTKCSSEFEKIYGKNPTSPLDKEEYLGYQIYKDQNTRLLWYGYSRCWKDRAATAQQVPDEEAIRQDQRLKDAALCRNPSVTNPNIYPDKDSDFRLGCENCHNAIMVEHIGITIKNADKLLVSPTPPAKTEDK